ncbi:tryptophan synthase subunit alpha [Halarsenatibacter silvermanii]|uniref:Tryptophan synthase alpha chain n=1 Tax=Halarsenatibacter silvermanii TaxID=321763 RepID=A0A1G9J5A3_9FIRM|nr:tryptophan synthase subunit alpha [Halarsenatibacter silvermanii]SDL32531.1 tryptophan synthase, alpha chain [Halarsenatibacter silvermanii]
MNNIERVFQEEEKALIPYICAGDPDLETTEELIFTLKEAGADIIELGIPFSDPLADGPVIQAAGQRALEEDVTLVDILDMVERISDEVKIPLVLMGYYNSVLNYGREKFAEDCARCGVSGVIIPDLPYEEDEKLYKNLNDRGVNGIMLAAPNTPSDRLSFLGDKSKGFLYCVSLLGVTGDERGPYERLDEYIGRVRDRVKLPLGLGFGIDGPEKAAAVSQYVDGIIMGSAIIEVIKDSQNAEEMHKNVGEFVAEIKEAIV